MLSNGNFWMGVAVGMIGVYAYHRVKGLPGKAGG